MNLHDRHSVLTHAFSSQTLGVTLVVEGKMAFKSDEHNNEHNAEHDNEHNDDKG